MKLNVYNELAAHISRRYAEREPYNLADFLTANHLFRSVDEAFIEFVTEHRPDILRLISDPLQRETLVAAMAEATKLYTWQRNQYIALPAQADTLLSDIYRALTERSRALLQTATDRAAVASAMRAVVDAHHERLTRFFTEVCTSGSGGGTAGDPSAAIEVFGSAAGGNAAAVGAGAFLRSVPCDEYSAELQLRLLAVDIDSLHEPVLDLGCGSSGTLVRFLRDEGVAAIGVDRLAPRETGFVRADWFDAPLEDAQWGTVLAHQSLSLHFLFHHQHATGQEERHAHLLMHVLRSLRPGGRFCCTPALPFFEPFIEDSTYRLQRFPHDMSGTRDELSGIAAALHIIRPER